MLKILIVDDYAVVRAGVRLIIEGQRKIANCGEASNGQEALARAISEEWDLVLLDISLPDGSGVEILELLKRHSPQLPVLMLSMHPSDEYAAQLLQFGADGYVQKDCAIDELVEAIRVVSMGERYFQPEVLKTMISSTGDSKDVPPHLLLSNRESKIFYRLCKGMSVSLISEELLLQVKTITANRKRIMRKMNLNNTVDMISYAVKYKLLD